MSDRITQEGARRIKLDRWLRVGVGVCGPVWLKVKWDGARLSISGVEGPKANGDARGSCGQCVEALTGIEPAPGFTRESLRQLRAVWDAWHLNDMRAGCSHQRAMWNPSRVVEVVSYKLTTEANRLRRDTLEAAGKAALKGEAFEPNPTARALAELVDWFRPRFTPPDADSPLSGCYEVEKREQKTLGWVKPGEHPDGMLGRPCEVCGYRYGHAWKTEIVPAGVVAFLARLPHEESGPMGWA